MNMQKIVVTCESAEDAIASKKSTKFFEKFVNTLEIPNSEKIISIFKRMKNKQWISEDDSAIFFLFLEHRNLSKKFEALSWELLSFDSAESQSDIGFVALKTELLEMLINSKLLTVLQNERLRSRIVEVEWKKGVCVLDEKYKQHFYEIIDQDIVNENDVRNGYHVWKDIRSWKYVVFDSDSFDIIFESRNEIVLQNGCFEGMMIDSYSHTHIFPNGLVTPFSKNVRYHEDKFHYYIIDFNGNRVHRVDKKHGTVWVETFPDYDLKESLWKLLIISLKKEAEFKVMYIDGSCKDTWWWDELSEYEILEWENILKVVSSEWEEKYFSSDGNEIK